jgi:hypothetical protein
LWTITLMILLYRFYWTGDNMYDDNDQSANPAVTSSSSSSSSSAILGKSRSTSSASRSVLAPNNSPAVVAAATEEEEPPFVVAYAVSFIKCGDFRTQSADLTDASLILRHSIHQISIRNPLSKSRYDYKMYALVHRQAVDCFTELNERTGFEVIVVDSPVRTDEIRGDTLRKNIHRELCCGADEFIKLYAYSMLPHDIVVHVDIDFAFYKPMDDLFDALRYDKDSVLGRAARARIHLERPEIGLPDRIDAFLTKDWPQVAPGKFPAAYQAGFLVARRDPALLEDMLEVIREGNYTAGWGYGTGWGLAGYSGWVGAMAMQGTVYSCRVVESFHPSFCWYWHLNRFFWSHFVSAGFVAYFYDIIRPNTAVELNQCRYNHMGMDVRYRHPPNFRPSLPGVGGCRNGAKQCEDCMVTDPKVTCVRSCLLCEASQTSNLVIATITGYLQRPLHHVPQALAVHGPGRAKGQVARRGTRLGH